MCKKLFTLILLILLPHYVTETALIQTSNLLSFMFMSLWLCFMVMFLVFHLTFQWHLTQLSDLEPFLVFLLAD